MADIILQGEVLANQIVETAQQRFREYAEAGRAAIFATVLIGDNPSSHKYVAMKQQEGLRLGVDVVDVTLGAGVSQAEVDERIAELNQTADAILVQYPLPSQLDYLDIITAIDPRRDVDGLHPYNLGMLLHDSVEPRGIPPCTPTGVIQLLRYGGVALDQANVTVVGNGLTAGAPLSKMLALRNQNGASATVTSVHSGTRDIAEHTIDADVVVGAAGQPGLITGDMVKEGATLVSVGVSYDEHGKAWGDFDETAKEKAGVFVPVTKGIGPMTRANLWANVVRCYELLHEQR